MEGLQHYGLEYNPYAIGELNPLSDPAHAAWLAKEVDGFSNLDVVERKIIERAAGKQPSFVIVVGGSGSGRSSVANYVIHVWKMARGVKRVLLPNPVQLSKDHDAIRRLVEWWAFVSNDLDFDLKLQRNLWADLDTRINDIGEKPDLAAGPKLQGAFGRLSQVLQQAAKDTAFAVLFEHVLDSTLISTSMTAFGTSDTVVVFTVDGSDRVAAEVIVPVLEQHKQSLEAPLLVELHDVSGSDVARVIEFRWRCVKKDGPIPFDSDDVTTAFSKPRPIGSVLDLIAQFLADRDAYFDGDERWPDDEADLRFRPGVLHKLLTNRP